MVLILGSIILVFAYLIFFHGFGLNERPRNFDTNSEKEPVKIPVDFKFDRKEHLAAFFAAALTYAILGSVVSLQIIGVQSPPISVLVTGLLIGALVSVVGSGINLSIFSNYGLDRIKFVASMIISALLIYGVFTLMDKSYVSIMSVFTMICYGAAAGLAGSVFATRN